MNRPQAPLAAAKALQADIEKFLNSPSDENLAIARQAWIASRVPYQQTEVYRFGNRIVDDWEGRLIVTRPVCLIDFLGAAAVSPFVVLPRLEEVEEVVEEVTKHEY